MALATPTRRALADLPLNTFGSPSTKTNIGKETMSNKRPVQEVADPEYPQPVFRVRVSPHPQSTPKDKTSRLVATCSDEGRAIEAAGLVHRVPSTEAAEAAKSIQPTSVDRPVIAISPAGTDEVEEGDSQSSCNSIVDLDPDDTMVSQQTTATELTQSLQSRASQHVESMRLRLRLAHFKVRTNQMHIPLAQLQISTSQDPTSPEHQPSLPKLLPAPILRPTTYSPLSITQTEIRSSPPCSPEPPLEATMCDDEVFRTPALPRHSTALRQTSRSPDGQMGSARKTYAEVDSLTSSAVRGKAAIGLLGLRQELGGR